MSNKKQQEYIFTGIAFTLFLAVVSYQLTNASLWYDETIEYWYSKYLVGDLPWADGFTNMYERIAYTYQPPLFNVLMYFWLKISDSVWWMRMFGVVMGFIGAVGVYKTMLFGTNSKIKSSVTIIIYAMIYRLTYYWQEVSEYALMLGLLSWTIYYVLLVLDKPNTKRIILFVIFCVLPVYSQYGAAFPVAAFVIMALVKIIRNRDVKQIKTLICGYAAAAVFAALPLYWFFLKPQMLHQEETELAVSNSFSLKNLYNSFFTVFEWNFIDDISDTSWHVLAVVLILMIVVALYYLLKGKRAWMKYLLAANMICYGLYYVAVLVGVYSYGTFGERYNLFLIPLWFVTGLLLIFCFFSEVLEMRKIKYLSEVVVIAEGVVIAGLFCWSYNGWTSISENWVKEDIRGATAKWISASGYETDTIVYYGADSGFTYYVTHNDNYTESMLDNVVFQILEQDREKTVEYYKEWIDEIYDEWPSSLYIIASHTRSDLNTFVGVFTDAGYTATYIYNYADGRLIYLELE